MQGARALAERYGVGWGMMHFASHPARRTTDRVPLGALDALGSDNILFETDFPHPTCLYPDSLSRAAEPLRAIDPGVRRKILSTNAATLYRIPVPDAA